MCRCLFVWCCWNKEGDDNKLSLLSSLCLRRRRRGWRGDAPSFFLWWCSSEEGDGSLLPSRSSLVVLRIILVVSGCL